MTASTLVGNLVSAVADAAINRCLTIEDSQASGGYVAEKLG